MGETMIVFWILVLFFGSSLVGAFTGSILELKSAMKTNSDELDFNTAGRLGILFYMVAYFILVFSIMLIAPLTYEDAAAYTVGSLISFIAGVFLTNLFAWMLIHGIALLTNRRYVNSGGPPYGM
jgi:hypothetical protein